MIATRFNVIEAFFDAPRVVKALGKMERRTLSRFGAFVRRRAQSSIKPRKRISRPGEPPSSHTGLLKHNIFFAFDSDRHAVVVGPVKLVGDGTAPEALEYGGTFDVHLGRQHRYVRTAHFRPRPFMGPALAIESPNFPNLFAGALVE